MAQVTHCERTTLVHLEFVPPVEGVGMVTIEIDRPEMTWRYVVRHDGLITEFRGYVRFKAMFPEAWAAVVKAMEVDLRSMHA